MLTLWLSVIPCVCSVISLFALLSIASSVRRLRDKFKASKGYDDPEDGYKVVPYDFDEKKSE